MGVPGPNDEPRQTGPPRRREGSEGTDAGDDGEEAGVGPDEIQRLTQQHRDVDRRAGRSVLYPVAVDAQGHLIVAATQGHPIRIGTKTFDRDVEGGGGTTAVGDADIVLFSIAP
jgi:hypothetical protein